MKISIKSLLSVCFLGGLLTAWLLHAQPQQSMTTSSKTPEQPQQPVKKSDAEWKQLLTPEQYRIARQSGTEAPNGKIYEQFKKQGAGTYYCAGCNAKLFSSKEKFDSHCGWPSFYDPANAKNIKQIPDPDGRRIEVRCAVCDAHLGHVFKGEGFNTPTDLRYCINGTVLKFVPDQKK
jgi:peptide-methionine (R)-S-oxide reductase